MTRFKHIRVLLIFSAFLPLSLSIQAQHQLVIESSFLPANDTVWVFEPQQKSEGVSYPLVFLLHGWSGNYSSWNKILSCQSLADSFKMIIVCPDGFYDSWYLNHPLRSGLRYADFFREELLPQLKSSYSIDSQHVFISGLSMGGFGALYLAAQNPGVFWAAASMSGVFDLSRTGLEKRGLPDVDGSRTFWKDKSLLFMMQDKCLPSIPVYLDCGTKDPYFNDSVLLAGLASVCNLDYHFEAYPGTHDHDFWRSAVYRHLEFFKESLPGY